MKRAVLFVIMLLVLSFVDSGWAAVFNVANETELRDALSAAASNGKPDTINITAGQYNTSGSAFSYNPVATENYPLIITGAGVGNTILDGGTADQVMGIDNLSGPDKNAHIIVRGITFQNGDSGALNGGGLNVATNRANVTVEGCEFIGNNAYRGGGAYAVSSSGIVKVTNNTFIGNTGNDRAGGVYALSSGTVIVANNIFDGNIAVWEGGGAIGQSYTGIVTFANNTFIGNAATSRRGGGVYAESSYGTLIFTNNIFDGNTAHDYGGGAFADSSYGTLIFINNIFDGNVASFNAGGGVYSHSLEGTMKFTNNTFSGNSAQWGGGFYIALNQDSATGYIYNNIAWNNTATVNGDDIYVDDDKDGNSTGSTVNLFNNDYGPDPNDFVVEAGDNLFQENNINTDPLFVDPATGDFHIEEDSLCIDAGKNSAPKLPATDFEGDPRMIDGDNDGKRKVDMGADEYRPVRLLTPNGGEVIPSGSFYNVQWVATLEAVSFKLKYSMDGGKTWRPIESGITEKSYGWTVPTPPKNKTKCLVKVMGYDASRKKIHADRSNSTFIIEVVKLTSPNGGQALTSGDPHIIIWTTRGTKKEVARVKLLYTKNGGKTWNAIETLTGNPGTYDWTVPDVPDTKSKCKVKVVLKDASGKKVGSDTSDSDFIIEPSL